MHSSFRAVLWTAVLAAIGIGGCGVNDSAKSTGLHPLPEDARNVIPRPFTDIPEVKPVIAKEGGRYLFEDKIKPGMTGYGLTVMTGGKIERFNFEVIDVVQDFSPGDNAILIRCSGLGLEHSGIIAGMSGSPCFIDGKMIGAVAFGWGMAKDPIAGVQPIRQMLAINPDAAKGRTESTFDGGGSGLINPALLREAKNVAGWNRLVTSLEKRSGSANLDTAKGRISDGANTVGMRRLVSPLMVSGLSPAAMKVLSDGLEGTGLVPVASGSGSNGDTELGGIGELKKGEIKLEPGSAIAIPLLTGDFDMSAIGTVTEVHDGKVYAFGHSFQAEGITSLPIATSYIYTVMPNVNQSFKMGTSLGTVGTLVMDEQTGIVGVLGASPSTVPVVIAVKDAELPVKIYHYQLAPHPKLTPVILNSVLTETLSAQRALPPQFTVHITGEVTFASADGGEPVHFKINNLGSTEGFRAQMTLLPVMVLSDNPFERLHITGLNISATIEHVNHGAAIRSVNVDRLTVAPGDEIHAVAEVENFRKEISRIPVTLRVPEDIADGDYEFLVGNSGMALEQESNYAPQRFDPQDIDALEDAVKKIEDYDPEKIYARLVLGISGASVSGKERPNLPVSRVMIYASNKRTDTAPIMRVVTDTFDAGAVVENGGQVFTVHVNHKANERYFSEKALENGNGNQSGGSREAHSKLLNQPPPASAPSDGG